MITIRSLPKAIVHVDCDSFFVSVEQALRPELKGKPVITGQERGIAAAMSLEAKQRGVTRGMSLHEVKKVCPDCILLPNNYEVYSLYSKRVFGIIRRFTPDIEEYSIDEAFCDITGLRRVYRTSYEEIALRIKQQLEKELGITVSVGLSLTKSLAKICSKHKKPSGFTCVKGHDLHYFLKQIEVQQVCGFGPASTALLAKHRILTVWDYVQCSEAFAQKLLGKVGIELWHELRGQAVYSVQTRIQRQVSLSKVKTFTPSSSDLEFIRAQLLRNLESAFIKLRRHQLRTKTLGIFVRDEEYRAESLGVGLSRSTSSIHDVSCIASRLLDTLFDSQKRYRQTGVYFSDLELDSEHQMELFENETRIQCLKGVSRCIDAINARYGKHTIHLGSTDILRVYQQHLGERGRIPQRKRELLVGETSRQRLNVPMWNLRL